MSSVTDENGSSQSRNAPLIKDAKRKKEKKTKKNGKDREVTEVAETSLNLESRKWKKTKIEAGIEVEGTQEETASEKPKKNKGKDQQNRDKGKAEGLPEGGNTSETVQETTTKKRRRELEMADDVFGRPKKKSKKLDFLDPREDLTLSEQAQKALSYAYTQFQHPKKWKFHKARQNWLIRNFWSDNTIPDVHVPLVLRYFANIQGGARENIMKTCMSIIRVSQDDKVQENQEKITVGQQSIEQTGTPPIQGHYEIKRKRATELLKVLQTSVA